MKQHSGKQSGRLMASGRRLLRAQQARSGAARCANNRLKATRHTTADANIQERRWLYIDVDPLRPAGISSSEEEHQAAIACGERIKDFLVNRGWPQPVVADSGNGCHLHYRLPAVPLDADGDALIKRCLEAISAKFSNACVKVDTVMDNRSRIAKLYGTVARKGDATPQRPHRLAKILEEPERAAPVPFELLEQLAAEAAMPEASPHREPPAAHAAGAFDIDGWLVRSGLEISRGPEPYNGGRRWILENICPFNPEHKKSAAIIQFATGALKFDCKHDSCQQHDWHALRELIEPNRKCGKQSAGRAAESGRSPSRSLRRPADPIGADVLPGVLGDYSQALAKHTETPTDLSILAVLGAASAATAGKIEIEAESGYIEPAHSGFAPCSSLGIARRR